MRGLLFVVVLAGAAGCPSEPPPACITVDTTCAPGYTPTFTNVYKNTLAKKCGSDNGSCHSATGHQAGLDFTDMATSYTELLSDSSIDPSRKRVVPDDAACSLLVVRTDSPGKDYQMPKGDALSTSESCAILQWVQMGAMQ